MAALAPVNKVLFECTDNSGRQYRFIQDAAEDVYADVHYGLEIINRVSQENIFVESNTTGLQQQASVSIAELDPADKKRALESFRRVVENVAVLDNEFQTLNGRVTDIRHRQTNAFLHEVDEIILVL